MLDREGHALQVQVERLLAGEAAMWLCHTGGVDIGCSTCRVSGVELSEVLKALHDPTERLRWDAGNFRCFEVLTRAEELDELQEDVPLGRHFAGQTPASEALSEAFRPRKRAKKHRMPSILEPLRLVFGVARGETPRGSTA